MLGLPSTTEVDRVLPKEAVVRNVKLDARLKESLRADVERLTVRNSLKAATLRVPDGSCVREVLLVEAALRARAVPQELLWAIARENAHKLVFLCTFGEEECAAVPLTRLVVTPWALRGLLRAPLRAEDMDAVWDSLASQLVYGDAGLRGRTVEQRFDHDERLAALRTECDRLDDRCRREVQPARKRALYEQARAAQEQADRLEREWEQDLL